MKKTLITGVIALSSFLPARAPEMGVKFRESRTNRSISLEKKAQELEQHYSVTDSLINSNLPVYQGLKDNCSGYVRMAGRELFGKDYSWTDAWDREKVEEKVYDFKSNDFDYGSKREEIDSLFNAGKLARGMIFGFYNPNSAYNKRGRNITHVGLFAGVDSNGEPIIIENRGRYQGVSKLEELEKLRYDLRNVFDENHAFMAEWGFGQAEDES